MSAALLLPLVGKLIDGIFPDPAQAAEAKLRAFEAAQRGELAALDADVKIAMAQTEVNKAEAGTDGFRGGWRPACGWVCAAGLAYALLFRPLLPWVAALFGKQMPDLPEIDMGTLLTLLGGMLGLGGLRTIERVRGAVPPGK